MTNRDNTIYYTITAIVFVGIVVCSLLFHSTGEPTNGDSERVSIIEIISTIVIAAAAVVTAGATIVLAVITSRYVRLTASLLKTTYKPQIVVYLQFRREDNRYRQRICVANSGAGVARNVKFGGDLSITVGGGIPLNRIDFIKNGIDALAPGQMKQDVVVFFDSSIETYLGRYLDKEEYSPLSITVTYEDPMGDDYDDKFTLNFSDFSISDQ